MIYFRYFVSFYQRLGSGSVGSARFWLPGSGSAKICGSTDPDPRCKYQPKTAKKKHFNSKLKSELLKKKKELIKISSFLNGSSSFRIKISKKIKLKFENYFLLKNFSKS